MPSVLLLISRTAWMTPSRELDDSLSSRPTRTVSTRSGPISIGWVLSSVENVIWASDVYRCAHEYPPGFHVPTSTSSFVLST
eukprot:7384996-Prymnesium_polylepis.1